MTACVNRKHTKKVAAVVTASLVGALSLGVAPVAAMAATTDVNVGDVWNDGIQFTWSVEADRFGDYAVPAGDQFILTGAQDPFGTAVSMSDITVVYFQDSNNNDALDAGELVWNKTPEQAGTYIALVLNGRYDASWWNNGTASNADIATAINNMQPKAVEFTVEAKSLDGAFAYEGENTSDTTFKFTGSKKDVNFADAAGNKIDPATDGVTVSWNDATLTNAGTYVATLKGDGTVYSGTETVTFEIDKVDFENDVFTVDTVATSANKFIGGNLQGTQIVKVNGEAFADGFISGSVVSAVDQNGNVWDPASSYTGATPAKVILKLTAYTSADPNNANNFTGDSATVEMTVVSNLVNTFFYDEESIPSDSAGDPILKFETAKGETFNPNLISAVYGGENVPVDVTVTKDGEVVTDYSEPGTYNAHVEVATPNDLSYGGSEDITVTVISRRYSEQPKAFIAIDGKDITVAAPEYDGEAVEPVIAVKAGSATVDPADYTVTYTDADGNAVESIVEPGTYYGTIDFGAAVIWKQGNSTPVDDIKFEFTVDKATIESAKADKDLYAETGEAVTPIFTAYTNDDLTGLSVEIDPSVTGVTYYKAKLDDNGTWWTDEDDEWVADEAAGAIKASDLKKAGKYVAVLTAPADDPHFTGETTSEMFEISEYAKFSDVDASAWYADAVYNAADLGYMTGISGTDLFMPMADITRAELAKVFANMAGEAFSPVYTPTKFGDVDPLAWYAGAVAWADEAGIVTGYDDVTFGPADKATREQVAVMLYRYAKGQGKDVAVEDADATLSAYKDADQVSDWAKEAMAWAVDNGIFGQGTDELWAKQNIQRCAVATIAVRFQPEALPEA